jgi:lysophospholipase L1-like esterase
VAEAVTPHLSSRGRTQIVCLGDSLTEASDVATGQSWHALAAARLGAELLNRGIGGDTTAGLLSRFYPEVIARRPQAVFLMGGANDLWWDLDLGPVQANLFAMVCQARSHRIVPVLGLPPPIDVGRARTHDMFQPRAGWEVCSRKLAQLVISLRAAAGACAVACLDFHRLFLTPEGTVRSELYLDTGLHPNPAGHRLMAELVVEVMPGIPGPGGSPLIS